MAALFAPKKEASYFIQPLSPVPKRSVASYVNSNAPLPGIVTHTVPDDWLPCSYASPPEKAGLDADPPRFQPPQFAHLSPVHISKVAVSVLIINSPTYAFDGLFDAA